MSDGQPQGCLTAILRLFGFRLGRTDDSSEEADVGGLKDLPYLLSDKFLSPAELSFFKVLRLAVKDQAVICAKVNLADLFFVPGSKASQSYRNKIDRKHTDFLICHPDTMKPLVGVELDDSSHARRDRIERDRFVDAVFQAAGLALIRIPARATYDPNALAAELTPHLGSERIAARITPQNPTATGSPVCPKCGVPMVQRVASKGQNAGTPFWGCKNYPQCREIVS